MNYHNTINELIKKKKQKTKNKNLRRRRLPPSCSLHLHHDSSFRQASFNQNPLSYLHQDHVSTASSNNFDHQSKPSQIFFLVVSNGNQAHRLSLQSSSSTIAIEIVSSQNHHAHHRGRLRFATSTAISSFSNGQLVHIYV